MATKAITIVAVFTQCAQSACSHRQHKQSRARSQMPCAVLTIRWMKDATAAQCIRACMKQRADFALTSGGKAYPEGDKSQFDKCTGQNVSVKGKVNRNAISVNSIELSNSEIAELVW